MLNAASTAGVDLLLNLPDQTIPQIEQPLLAQLAGMTLPRDTVRYRTRVALLARYATGAIVADMERLYADWQRSPQTRPSVRRSRPTWIAGGSRHHDRRPSHPRLVAE
jgi:hypothetical protein